jgi:limonene-1,2-epoxide hydrolase
MERSRIRTFREHAPRSRGTAARLRRPQLAPAALVTTGDGRILTGQPRPGEASPHRVRFASTRRHSGRQTMTSEAEAEQIVRDFCAVFERHDAEALRPFLADDVVYHNIPMDPVVGIDATIAFAESFLGMCQSMVIDTLHLAVRGNIVLTERIDTFTVNDVVAPLPVMGTFEIRDGKIAAWRDYFDMAQITSALSGAS